MAAVYMKGTGEETLIHQCLHGYEDGHRLLESSLSLEKSVHAKLLRMSDAAFTGFNISHPSYLTGYPLKEINAYALAKTWPAKELPRPGCVWTHTLLIDYGSLASMQWLPALKKLFKKPSENLRSYYSHSVSINVQAMASTLGNNTHELDAEIRNMLYEIYSNPEETVSFAASEQMENALLVIWNQQWPKLRRSFSFRTLTTTSAKNTEFDIILVDSGSYRSWGQTSLFDRPSVNPWAEIGVTDALKKNGSDLRKFLWRFGADCIPSRSVYPKLVNVWIQLFENDCPNFERAWDIVDDWQSPPQSLLLFLLDQSLQSDTYLDNHTLQQRMIGALHKVDDQLLVSNNLLTKILGWIRRWSAEDIIETILINKSIPRKIVQATLKEMDVHRLVSIVSTQEELLESIVEYRADVLNSALFWENQSISKSTVRLLEHHRDRLTAILPAIITSQAHHLIHEILERFPQETKKAALSIQRPPHEIARWLNAIVKSPSELLALFYENLNIPIDTLAYLSKSIRVDQPNPSPKKDAWLSALKGQTLTRDHVVLALYLLERGLMRVPPDPVSLIKSSFDIVYSYAEAGKMDGSTIYQLKKHLPYSYWSYWDYCDTLRKGIVDLFVREQFPAEDFLEITNNEIAFETMIKYAAKKEAAKTLLISIQNSSAASKAKDKHRKFAIVEKYISDHQESSKPPSKSEASSKRKKAKNKKGK